MTLAGTEGEAMTTDSCWSLVCVFYNHITLEILLYSVCTVFGGCVKSSEVYFMIIYCYDINSLSCLTRIIHDTLHVPDSHRVHEHFYKSTMFLRVLRAGSVSFFSPSGFFFSGFILVGLVQMLLLLHLKLNKIQLYKQLLISP